ncbi:UDP-glucose dehydrogenase family protein [Geothermobacter hydrogeniphilus]|uniref:UDP-glucose 6-dehydrogenase n=1 Tax=Geothermobacter hydrogeniphilus TaxID=1969733 RepID=A0A1X0XI21_9BACT|nr:UDP-glucose/GDP-mannose dehydrogenase family protein [Geothermobacter hydrogeniphilus]ORJ52535.1 UDP-glucose 6-dehydrogenase [Geothermobacter hydrogeniphilus]
MHIVVVGTGYVGLVTGACFAEMGLTVTCVDIDAAKVAALREGIIPIHEPGLETLVKTNVAEGRLMFTTSLAEAMASSGIYFIAVGTPSGEDGSADLRHVLNVAREIGRNLTSYAVIVDKSTVPVGTADQVRAAIREELDARGEQLEFDVVSNPEFLKEGAAVADFMKPDRIIVGADSERAAETMRRIYAPFNRNRLRTLFMGVRDAEMTKYAANAMLATKISFINEIAALCDCLDVDVENVRRGIGSDQRIGFQFIYPGCGYGGSCFPKDVKALIHTARNCDFTPRLLDAVEQRNREQRRVLFDKITARFGADLSGLSFGLWGLAFKPGTDDMREAPSKVLIEALLAAGARVRAYDPVAMEVARRELPAAALADGRLVLADNQYAALAGVDAMVLVTEWKPFRFPDFAAMKTAMKQPIIFDGRNQYDPRMISDEGFEYVGIGRRG